MKITKSQLKEIIKEEFSSILKEAPRYRDPNASEWGTQIGVDLYVNLTDEQKSALDDLERAVNRCIDAGVADADMKDTIESRTMS